MEFSTLVLFTFIVFAGLLYLGKKFRENESPGEIVYGQAFFLATILFSLVIKYLQSMAVC